MAFDIVDSTPITHKSELIDWIAQGTKPVSQFKIGTEHEKFAFYTATHAPVPYEGQNGIRALLEWMQAQSGWEYIIENGQPIGLSDATGGGAISLEPGGQFELSGAPLATIHETYAETHEHLRLVKQVAQPLGIGFLSLASSPKWALAQTPIMPKARYKIMANYMPKVGARGLDMMFGTCTVQANLDFSSEADMVKKLRVSLALQPIVTALFANSPFTNGKLNGFQSARSEIWRDTDNARAGMLPFAFETGMGFERYVDYALDVPMYFIKRGDVYRDVSGSSFRTLLERGEASISDWANHLGTIFPEVRLKKYLEMRGGDVGSLPMIAAFSALWAGLFYNDTALNAAWDVAEDWNAHERQKLRDDVPRLAFKAQIAGHSVLDIAREVLNIAASGLKVRALTNEKGQDESIYLEPLYGLVNEGKTQAQHLIALFQGKWNGNIEPVFEECIF